MTDEPFDYGTWFQSPTSTKFDALKEEHGSVTREVAIENFTLEELREIATFLSVDGANEMSSEEILAALYPPAF